MFNDQYLLQSGYLQGSKISLNTKTFSTFTESIDPFILIKDYKPDLIAQQLTRIEFDIWKSIEPYELLSKAWCTEKLRHKAIHVRDLINRSNTVSLWVASSILFEEKVKDRTKILSKFIRIARELYNLNNFSSLIAIISGINNAAVRRLKLTFENLKGKYLEELEFLEKQIATDDGYKGLRDTIHTKNPPIIPFLGIYLTQLIYIEDGNPDYINHLINFRKKELIYMVIDEVQQYQLIDYNLEENCNIMNLLYDPPFNQEKELISISLMREARKI